ncbi:hypothetical protein ACIBQ1_60370 [Nonomuraea sp. NPDC050153]|uniref:hypothetical protein n=1 Tax=Nonomuraea sp. NPDC050153 TaxID=3364359 RepID=UPI003797EE76
MHPDTARRRFGQQADMDHTSPTPHHDEDQNDKGDAGDGGDGGPADDGRLLPEDLWRLLAAAYAAGEHGRWIAQDGPAWSRLGVSHRRRGVEVAYVISRDQRGRQEDTRRWITETGRAHVRANADRYRARYPHIELHEPGPDFAPFTDPVDQQLLADIATGVLAGPYADIPAFYRGDGWHDQAERRVHHHVERLRDRGLVTLKAGDVRALTAAGHARLAELAGTGPRPAPLPEADPTPTADAAAPSSAREPAVEEPATRTRGRRATPAPVDADQTDVGQALTEASGEGLAEGLAGGLAEHAQPVDQRPPAAPVSEVYLAQLGGGNRVLLVDGARVGWLHPAPEGWQVHDRHGRLVTTLPADDAPGHGVVVGLDLARRAAAALGIGGAERAGVTVGRLDDHRGRTMDTSPAALASWSLLKGRVPGRVDVIVRGRCVGWLQRDSRGRDVACTLDGPVPGSAGTNRVQAVTALLAALIAPAPLPELDPEARTARRPRARSPRERPISPFTPAQLAAAALTENLPRLADGSYRVHIDDGYDDTELGRVYRTGRRWQALNPDGRVVVRRAASRTEAVDQLLATPGPLFGDPADTVLHDVHDL